MKKNAYTSAEEIPIVAKFFMGEVDSLTNLPGKYENVETFEKYSCAAVEIKFEMACSDLLPLLQGIPIMVMGIYLSMDEGSAGAYYMFEESEAAEGRYFFQVPYPFIRHCLRQFWDEEEDFPAEINYVPHHEIIHMLDDREVKRFQQFYDCTDSRQFLVSYFSHFRKEGLAGLYGFLKQSKKGSWEEARTELNTDFMDLMKHNWKDPVAFEAMESRIFTHVVNSSGPWMILHALYVSAEDDQKERMVNVFLDLQLGAEISHDVILFLIKRGLDLDLETFVTALGKSNWNGVSMIDSGVLHHFANTLYNINRSKEFPIREGARQSAHKEFLKFFKEMWITNAEVNGIPKS